MDAQDVNILRQKAWKLGYATALIDAYNNDALTETNMRCLIDTLSWSRDDLHRSGLDSDEVLVLDVFFEDET